MKTTLLSSTIAKSAISIAALVLAAAPSNAAFLDGRTLTVQLEHQATVTPPSVGNTTNVVVGPGVELEAFRVEPSQGTSVSLDVDITDTTIRITLQNDQPPAFLEVLRVTDPVNTADYFRGFNLRPESNWAGFDSSRIDVDVGVITVNMSQLSGLAGQQIYFDVIPEPAGVALLGTCSVGAVALRRRARRVARR